MESQFSSREALKKVLSGPPGFDAARSWEALSRKLEDSRDNAYEGWYSTGDLRRWAGYATTVAVIAIMVAWAVGQVNTGKPYTYTTYTTRAGQRASFTLDDGSRITLGPVTTLRVRSNRSEGKTVEISGEAMFTVQHASTHTFTVMSHGVITRVLGTEFVVRAYDPKHIQVAVRDGRVSLQSSTLAGTNTSIVTAGEEAFIALNELPSIRPIVDPATEFSWANGDLVLRDMPLGEAFVRLSRWYNMAFQASEPSLLKAEVNGIFPVIFSQADMRNIARVIGAQVTVSAGTVTFSK